MASPTNPAATAANDPRPPSPTATPPLDGLGVAADVPDELPDELAVAVAVTAAGIKFPAVTVTGCNVIEFVGYKVSPSSTRLPVVVAATKLAAEIPFMQVAILVVPSY